MHVSDDNEATVTERLIGRVLWDLRSAFLLAGDSPGVLGWNENGRLVKSCPLYFAPYSLERWRLYGDGFGGVDLYRRQPAEAIRLESVGYSVELVGDFLRDKFIVAGYDFDLDSLPF